MHFEVWAQFKEAPIFGEKFQDEKGESAQKAEADQKRQKNQGIEKAKDPIKEMGKKCEKEEIKQSIPENIPKNETTILKKNTDDEGQ